MTKYDQVQADLMKEPRKWLVTGAAGFIGSHLVEKLLSLDQPVTGMDNFATGHRRNLDDVKRRVTPIQWARFTFIEGDICRIDDCKRACMGIDYVLHQAALGSVPRSIEDPLRSHAANVDGFINMLVAVRAAKVRRLVYASSSAVYGDHPALPKVEGNIGQPLSPYSATKLMNEIYAEVFARTYNLTTVGLRYFNVFGPRQDPNGAYAAVIPKWFSVLLAGERVVINGDGETSRDFCYIDNVVQANLLSAIADSINGARIYNVAVGDRTSLKSLFHSIRSLVPETLAVVGTEDPSFGPERVGDIRHSLAEIAAIKQDLGYRPTVTLHEGLRRARAWYGD